MTPRTPPSLLNSRDDYRRKQQGGGGIVGADGLLIDGSVVVGTTTTTTTTAVTSTTTTTNINLCNGSHCHWGRTVQGITIIRGGTLPGRTTGTGGIMATDAAPWWGAHPQEGEVQEPQ